MNLVRYFLKYMHYPVAQSSNMVTNFVGTSYLLTVVAGYINDCYLSKLTAFVLYATIELLGVILLTYQAKNSNLLPPENETPSTFQAAILYIGLGAMAIGIGGTKATLPTHGADQLDHTKENLISSFFSWYYMSVTTAAGFPFYRGKKPSGSPLRRLIKVFLASNHNTNDTTTLEVHHSPKEQSYAKEKSYNKFKFLNKALNDDTIEVAQVEDTKAFLGFLPILATTIMLNCSTAQLMTFSVQQGNFMNRKIYNITITTQSISVIPLVVVLVFLYLFEQSKRFYGNNEAINKIYQPLVRMGAGLAVSSMSMAVAALVEYKRLKEFNEGNLMSAFWLIGQTLLVTSAEVFVVGGMLEHFYSKAPNGMKSISTALACCSSSMGYFLSSMLVTVCNSVSGIFGQAWIGGNDLNHDSGEFEPLPYAILITAILEYAGVSFPGKSKISLDVHDKIDVDVIHKMGFFWDTNDMIYKHRGDHQATNPENPSANPPSHPAFCVESSSYDSTPTSQMFMDELYSLKGYITTRMDAFETANLHVKEELKCISNCD
ncbi:PREDICTED: protein NRT1/ PTR FAMILY 4.2-like [Lupinus angustifolius]|uniref:protein NRT1/ PTR FAMILY 4.2-like n=1 Tax=Lupinus angustifolius TaxID=3871 RepID=UPI00092F29DF|nr:PREDICTED: protein NRT1/ PTR FAMILY 4.2-like [Lupinus angustifolius]